MKIIDYGIWFECVGSGAWWKKPVRHYDVRIYFNGEVVGYYSGYYMSHIVEINLLKNIGFKIKADAPAVLYESVWQFNPRYTPLDSDFEPNF